MVREALAAAGVAVRDLDRVGVVIGPGAFAGVRVGLAFARALALGTRLDVVGVTSLAALAESADVGGLVAPVIDARRGQVYAALFEDGRERVAPFVAAPGEAAGRLVEAAGAPFRLVGDGARLLPHDDRYSVYGATEHIDATALVRLAARAPKPDAPPAPLYLRPPDATPGAPSPFEGLFDRIGDP